MPWITKEFMNVSLNSNYWFQDWRWGQNGRREYYIPPTLSGDQIELEDRDIICYRYFVYFRDHVVLILNVASKWGFTDKNYTQLQALHAKYAELYIK
jgi:hypothetical protein